MTLPAGVSAVFPFSPNWTNPVVETREYKTDVLRSRNRTGQWRALRFKPRDFLEYDILLEADEAASFDYRLWALQPQVWMLPHWPRRRALTAAAANGTDTLVLDGVVSQLAAAGDEYILMVDGQEPEVVTLDAVSGDRLTLSLAAPLEADWPAWTAVYPAWQAQFADRVRGQKLSDSVLQAPLRFRRLVDSRAPQAAVLAADIEVGGLEVLIRTVDWGNALEVGYDWIADFSDAETGPFTYEVPATVAPRSRQAEVLCETRDELDWWLAFFDRRRGRQKPFLMPTWQGDLRLQAPVGVGYDFEIGSTELGRFMPENSVHTHIMIRKRDGSLAFYEVSDIEPDFGLGVSSIVTVDPWDEAYGPWECPQACFVTICHLASDTLSITWITDEVTRLTLAVQTEEIAE